MVNLEFPIALEVSLYEDIKHCENIDKRIFKIEHIQLKLKIIADNITKLKKYRENFLKEENVSVINLSTVQHCKKLDNNGCVLIKIQEHILPITVADHVIINDDYDCYNYSINKIENTQLLYYASKHDLAYHKLIYIYMVLKNRYSYKIGNRIHLLSYGGTYIITSIQNDYVTISCKKWKIEKKPDRKVNFKDIKGLVNEFNSL